MAWLVENHAALGNAREMHWSMVQPVLICEGIDDLLTLMEAASPDALKPWPIAVRCWPGLARRSIRRRC